MLGCFGVRDKGLPVAAQTYLFRVPCSGFYIEFIKKVGLLGHR